MDATGVVEFKDFDASETPIGFRVGMDEFLAVPGIGIGVMADMVGAYSKLGALGGLNTADPNAILTAIEAIKSLFKLLLLDDDSYTRFVDRLTSRTKPIGVPTLMQIINWLLEKYGLRPTTPSTTSSSVDGDVESSTSTDGQPATEPETGLASQPGES